MTAPSEAVRVAIAGAASLRGKELKQWLEESSFLAGEIRLLDEDFIAGTLTEAGGEPTVIKTVQEDSFAGVRFVFFTGSAGFSARHVAEACRAGGTVIDLSGGLAKQPGSRCWIPALDPVLEPPMRKAGAGESQGIYVVPLAPAIIAASLSAAFAPLGLGRLVITFFQPVSERDQEGIEELESQVVKLLSFEPISKSVFDAQVGFNLLSRFGEGSGEKLADARAEIVGSVRGYLGDRALMPAITLVHAPVFYSHAFSAYAEFERIPVVEDLVARMEDAGLKVVGPDEAAPDNVNVAGEMRPVLARPERDSLIENSVWLWGAADNLRVPVVNAVSIAEKLLAS
jgi:aspartate-semialdehyde dehydrogenase